jgi:hypothetical protein
MNKKLLLFLIFIPLLALQLQGQEQEQKQRRKFLYLETGMDAIGCEVPDKPYIRSVNDENYFYYSDQIRSFMTINYVGIKLEYRLIRNLLGISGGLRYSRMMTSIGRDSYLTPGQNYFYVRYNQNDQVTEYARVREIDQNGDYLGIPLELRICPGKERRVKAYYIAGLSYNVRMHSKTDISFSDDAMNQYKSEVKSVIEKASPSFTTFHLGVGLKIGKTDKPGISVEANVPVGVVFPGGSYLASPTAGGGFQLLVRVPLTKNAEE